MAIVTIPLLLKDVTGGARRADVPGTSLAEVLRALDGLYPGIEARIQRNGKLDPNLLLAVDGTIVTGGLATPLGPESEVSILPRLGGG